MGRAAHRQAATAGAPVVMSPAANEAGVRPPPATTTAIARALVPGPSPCRRCPADVTMSTSCMPTTADGGGHHQVAAREHHPGHPAGVRTSAESMATSGDHRATREGTRVATMARTSGLVDDVTGRPRARRRVEPAVSSWSRSRPSPEGPVEPEPVMAKRRPWRRPRPDGTAALRPVRRDRASGPGRR